MAKSLKDLSPIGIQAEIAHARVAFANNDTLKCIDGKLRAGNELSAYISRLSDMLPDGFPGGSMTYPMDQVKPLTGYNPQTNKATVTKLDANKARKR